VDDEETVRAPLVPRRLGVRPPEIPLLVVLLERGVHALQDGAPKPEIGAGLDLTSARVEGVLERLGMVSAPLTSRGCRRPPSPEDDGALAPLPELRVATGWRAAVERLRQPEKWT
jgi:hypothetical protein